MDTVYRIAAIGMRILRSRLFAAAILAVISAAMVTYVSVNMHAVTVIDGDNRRVVMTMADDPRDVVAAAGMALGAGDQLITHLYDSNAQIEINRAYNVQVTVDGVTTVVRMSGGTVGDVLTELGVEIGSDDLTNVHPDQEITDDLNICVERVQYEEFTKTEAIPYESTIKYTNTIAKGKTMINQAGKKGVKTYTYRNRIVDGEVVETVLVNEEITTKPVTEIKLVGTVTGTPLSPAPFDIELDDKGHPVNYKRCYTGKATAYTNEGGRLSQWTASGMRAQVGVVAVDPKKIPYGTKLYIVSPNGSYVYGYAIAGDIGSGVENGSLVADLFMDTYQECIQFGKRQMVVYVLE